MKLLSRLFEKAPSVQDVRLQLKQIERDQRKKRRELEALAQSKQAKVEAAVTAKKAGRQELIQDIFRDMRQAEIDHGYLSNDLRRLSLARTALTAFLRKAEILEKSNDRKSLQNLVRRYSSSSLQKTIDLAEVDDETFGNMLEEILGEEEISVAGDKVHEDAGFAEFDRAIEQMAKAEDIGVPAQSRQAAATRTKAQRGSGPKILSEENDEIEKEIREMEKMLEEMNKELEQLDRDLAELRALAESLKNQEDQKDEELQAQQAELDQLIAEGEGHKALGEALRAQISLGLTLIKDLRDMLKDTEQKVNVLENKRTEKEQSVRAKEQEIAMLRSHLA